MLKILVADVKSRQTTQGEAIDLIDVRDVAYSGLVKDFSGLKSVKAGDTVTAEVTVKGKYRNITKVISIVPAGHRPREEHTPGSSIAPEIAARIVADLYIAGKIPVSPVGEALLNGMFAWCTRNLGITLPKTEAVSG